jgi:L-fuculose-phosphate aldolase
MLLERTADKLEINAAGDFKYDIVGQAQHGCCAIGRSPWHAFEHVERLEHICKITLAAKK